MNKWKRMLAIAVIGCAPMVATGCDPLDAALNQVIGTIDDGNDTLGDQIGDLIDLLSD